ncbi:MAG TPA: Rpn family recombination-promoting nuclease/putative transposase [Thermoanaerobaculia bacterium]
MADHDTGYKMLFSHPEMVADLLRGFVHEDWVAQLDFSTLEKVPASFISTKRHKRESDIIWRLRWRGRDQWLYVYLLLEFQSKPDPFMAVRVMTYVGLLYQELIRQHHLTPSGLLPPVLPIVIYNGKDLWGGAQEIAELIETVPGGLESYRPRLRYCLLDEGRIALSDLESLRNLTAALIRLERSRHPEDVRGVLESLSLWLNEPGLSELRRSFSTWVNQILLPSRLPGVQIPEAKDLEEVKSMLAERVVEWTQEWKQEGVQKGIEESAERLRKVLLSKLEQRFGPLPEDARRRIESIGSIEELGELLVRSATVPSLDALF